MYGRCHRWPCFSGLRLLLAGASDRELPAAIAATSPRPATARVRGQAATESTRGTRAALAHPRTRKPTLWGELMRTSQPQDVEATARTAVDVLVDARRRTRKIELHLGTICSWPRDPAQGRATVAPQRWSTELCEL